MPKLRYASVGLRCIATALATLTLFAQEPLRVSFGLSVAPLEYRDQQGRPAGFAVEAIQEAARRARIPLRFQVGGTSRQNTESLIKGQLDLIPAGTTTSERERDLYVSDTWWWGEMLAVVPVASPIRTDSELQRHRIAVPAAGMATILKYYPNASIVPAESARAAVGMACSGAADVAVIEGMFLRQLLLGLDPACRDTGLTTFDIRARHEYHLVARRERADDAKRLRRELEEMTADGTLLSIAARKLPVSAPEGTRVAELLRAQNQREVHRLAYGFGGLTLVLLGLFLAWLFRSRRKLRVLNERLVVSEQQLKAAFSRLETAFHHLDDGVLIFDSSLTIIYANQAAVRILGAATGQPSDKLHFWSRDGSRVPSDESPFLRIMQSRELEADYHLSAHPTPTIVECSGCHLQGGLAMLVVKDVTEARRAAQMGEALQEEIVRTQKMESIGRLAGGVAHDFNNLLTVINGYASLLLDQSSEDGQTRRLLQQILHAGESAALLTRQLLTFGRAQPFRATAIQLNTVVSETAEFIRRLIGEDIELSISAAPGLWPLSADSSQMQQVLLNLATNARDAMPGGGRLSISTENVPMAQPSHSSIATPCVLLTVSDSGVGMSREVRKRIFEPFFTTKAVGKGNGLGLATVYGIVQKHSGWLEVSSEEGKGSTFRIYLPCLAAGTDTAVTPIPGEPVRGNEKILVVEDQDEVRHFAAEVLRACGYRVEEAANGQEALRKLSESQFEVDLVLTDVVMPGMNGGQLAQELARIRPNLPVLFMSGYPGDMISVGTNFLSKPLSRDTLAARVRQMLGGA